MDMDDSLFIKLPDLNAISYMFIPILMIFLSIPYLGVSTRYLVAEISAIEL